MTSVYEAACEYVERGYSVIPIETLGKKPLINWRDYQTRQPTQDELSRWFYHADAPNIALVTGRVSGVFVLDEDGYKDDATSIADQYPTDMIQSTPRGGRHYFYKISPEDDVHNTAGRYGSGIDTRGEGGYVLLYPSQVKLADGSTGQYTWVKTGQPAPIPEAFKSADGDDLGTGKRVVTESGTLTGDDLDLLQTIMLHGFSPGQHNDELHRLARLFARMSVWGDETQRIRMAKTILQTLDAQDVTPQQASGNFEPTVSSAFTYEYNRLQQKKNEDTTQDEDALLQVKSYLDMMYAYQDYEPSYLIDQLVPDESFIIISAPPETYKTWLLLDIAITTALGGLFPGVFDTFKSSSKEPQPVLIFQQEDHPGQLLRRMQCIIMSKVVKCSWDVVNHYGVPTVVNPADPPIHMHDRAQLALDNPRSIEMLELRIKQTGAKLICIDPMYSLADSDDYFAKAARQLQEFKRLINTYGVTIIIAHHDKKSAVFDDGREGMYGSTLLNGATHGVIRLGQGKTPTSLRMKRSGKNYPDKLEWTVNLDIDTERTVYNGDVEPVTMSSTDQKRESIIQMLTGVNMSYSDIVDQAGFSESSVKRYLKALKDDGTLIQDDRGQYMLREQPL